ncbi:hypothetical protein COV17_02765 [Candidatus Woesearchaeota archaeon CG10_big_fil_rev_8_21_14_0_10_36_11]|nr:MAG: hypothetical protein COV17_02765 [Candidatus Woesearchaeota archaeon CG10_big_fil_rev_8_21_14_0_10_36_11]
MGLEHALRTIGFPEGTRLQDITFADVRKQYRLASLESHPDRQKDDLNAEENWKLFQKAYFELETYCTERKQQLNADTRNGTVNIAGNEVLREARVKVTGLADLFRQENVKTRDEAYRQAEVLRGEFEDQVRHIRQQEQKRKRATPYHHKAAKTIPTRSHPGTRTEPVESIEQKQSLESNINEHVEQGKKAVGIAKRFVPKRLTWDSLFMSVFGKQFGSPTYIPTEVLSHFVDPLIYAQWMTKGTNAEDIDITINLAGKLIVDGLSTDQMITAASCAMVILEEATDYYLWEDASLRQISPQYYFDMFGPVYHTLLPHCKAEDVIPQVTKLVNVVELLIPFYQRKQDEAKKRGELISVSLEQRTLEEAISLVESTETFFARVGYTIDRGKILSTVSDIAITLREKGFQHEQFMGLWNVIKTIRQNHPLRLNMTSVNYWQAFMEMMVETILPESVPHAIDFVKAVSDGAKTYLNANTEPAREEWRRTFEKHFAFFVMHPHKFKVATNALYPLKLDEKGKQTTYPGIIDVTVEAAAYAGKRITEEANGDTEFVGGFKDLLRGFVRSSYYQYRQKRVYEPLTQTQRDVYEFLKTVKIGRSQPKIPAQRLVPADIDTLLELYTR